MNIGAEAREDGGLGERADVYWHVRVPGGEESDNFRAAAGMAETVAGDVV
jgi:hypothetical protein